MITVDCAQMSQALSMIDAIQGLAAYYSGEQRDDSYAVFPRQVFELEGRDGLFIVTPSRANNSEFLGVKATTIHRTNPSHGLPLTHGTFVLICGDTGRPLALMDGIALTTLRTAAAAGFATMALAPTSARTLAVVGAGKQAAGLIDAMLAVRGIDRINIWSPSGLSAQRLASTAAAQYPESECVATKGLKETLSGADIICTATSTSSSEPLIALHDVSPTTHINAIGGSSKTALELDARLCRSGSTYVDDAVAAPNDCGEIGEAIRRGYLLTSTLRTLGDLKAITERHPSTDQHPTVYRSVGTASLDMAVGSLIYKSARARLCKSGEAHV